MGVLHKLRIILNEDSLIQFLNHTSKRYNSLSTKLTTMKTNHTIDNLPKNILEFFPLVFTSPEGKQFAICVSWENLLLAIHQRRWHWLLELTVYRLDALPTTFIKNPYLRRRIWKVCFSCQLKGAKNRPLRWEELIFMVDSTTDVSKM